MSGAVKSVARVGGLSTGLLACLVLLASCNTAGSAWMSQPLGPADSDAMRVEDANWQTGASAPPSRRHPSSRRLSLVDSSSLGSGPGGVERPAVEGEGAPTLGRSLGQFRNTYYDFPNEADFDGGPVPLMNGACQLIREVPRSFFESVCVQGSGTLRVGKTVSFARRDCECAEVCPRTQQKICFDVLDANAFPWGRGSTGKPIVPFVTVAVDPEVIPLGTPIYVPEYDGVPRDPSAHSTHDGCFIAQDRGIRVKGKHIDVFTGDPAMTSIWNQQVPSNRGVAVYVDSPRCRRGP
ncbi:MAG TPA: 3D domain-containing protein [Polyangiaceae bacterium]|nr:3D domain-containing protein [Polyangiaceae bacterium]